MTAIRTPDQRLRIFISSTLTELAAERLAAQEAITKLRLTPILFELGARPHAPRSLYRAYLEQSDVFIGIYWERYGWMAPGENLSGLEDEYERAGELPKLIYVKTPAPEREPRLQSLLGRIQKDDGACYRRFSTTTELRELIENDLALLLTERFTVGQQTDTLSSDDRPALYALPVPRGRLVDRKVEVTLARQLLIDREVGLVTLTGPGGGGKTRLALHIAAKLRGAFADGVYFVPLDGIEHESEVVPTVARALGIRASGEPIEPHQLIDRIQSKRIMLVMDNFEHLLGAAPLVNDLLERCPRLKILATSRAALRVRGERELPVPPLAGPEGYDRASGRPVEEYPAVELFVARAREVDPTFVVTDQTAAAVAEICMRLDGLPLALELAAARIKVLPPKALLERLERRLPILAGGARDYPARHQTMRNAIEWSYNMLDESERALFRRLSVFVGGFELQAAEAVCTAQSEDDGSNGGLHGGQAAVLDPFAIPLMVESLLDDNLLWIRKTADGDVRFDMLQTIREFGLEVLAACGEGDTVRRLHAAWCLALAEHAAPELIGPNQSAWLARLDAEHANLRSVMEWSLNTEQSAEIPLRLGVALWRYWWTRGYARDALGWITRALNRPWQGQPAVRGLALRAAAELAEAQADHQQAQRWYDEALGVFRSIGDEGGEAASLNGLGWTLRSQGALDRAQSLHERALAMFRRLGDQRATGTALNALGAIAYVRGAAEDATSYWNECLAVMRAIGDDRSVGAALGNLGILAVMRGDAARAIALHEESLAIARSLGDREGADHSLANLGRALYEHGDLSKAIEAYEEALEGCRQADDNGAEADILNNLGEIARVQGNLPLAADRFAESLRLFHMTKSLPGVASVLEQIGAIAVERGASHEAVRLWAAADAIRRETGAAPEHGEVKCRVNNAHAGLAEDAFEAAWSSGAGLTVDDAVAEALEYAMECAARR